MREFRSVVLDDSASEIVLIDQTRLPNEVKYLRLSKLDDIWEAIRSLRVRGAPAIGIAAAYGAYVAVKAEAPATVPDLRRAFERAKDRLETSRQTAVNLFWALERMQKRLMAALERLAEGNAGEPEAVAYLLGELKAEAEAIRDEDALMCRSIGERGLSLLKPGMGVLTHCNAGALATSEWGTALAPLYLGHERGYQFKVFADETRPLLQGARLTAWELSRAGLDVTVICDNMAASVMRRGAVQAVLVGCDRIAANGDVANKIGTLGVAVLARHFGIPFFVLGPTSTIDWNCASGAGISIEERSPEEVTTAWYSARMVPSGVPVLNPAFDVTDASLIAAIITEKGIARPPLAASLRALRD